MVEKNWGENIPKENVENFYLSFNRERKIVNEVEWK